MSGSTVAVRKCRATKVEHNVMTSWEGGDRGWLRWQNPMQRPDDDCHQFHATHRCAHTCSTTI